MKNSKRFSLASPSCFTIPPSHFCSSRCIYLFIWLLSFDFVVFYIIIFVVVVVVFLFLFLFLFFCWHLLLWKIFWRADLMAGEIETNQLKFVARSDDDEDLSISWHSCSHNNNIKPNSLAIITVAIPARLGNQKRS